MGATYTRQSSSNIVDGAVIEASDLNNEFDQLLAAFAVSTGHTHDGTAAEGGPIAKLLSNTLTFGAGTAGTDITITFDGETSDGIMYWMEDEDHFKFADDIVVDSTKRLYFNDEGGEYIYGDGTDLYLTSGADINIPANIGLTFGDDGEKIEGDGTDLTISANNLNVDAAADITLDAGGADIKFADDGTNLLGFANSSSDVVIKPLVDAKDIIFHQYDGTSILEINDGAYAKFTAAAVAPEATLTDGATVSWNALTQQVAKLTLGGNRTLGSASSGVTGEFISLLVIQDGTGSRTVTWNAAYEFASDTAPTLTTTANLGDLFVFRYNGSKWLEVGRNLALTLS